MILDPKHEGMAYKTDLLDDVVGGAPAFDDKPSAKPVNGLVVGTVNPLKPMLRSPRVANRLDIVHFSLG